MFSLIDLAHPVQMALKISAGNKFRQDPLVDPGHGGGIKSSFRQVYRQQRLRQHHISHTDCRSNGLRECSHVNDTSVLVHPLKCRDRFSLVTEFTVIVILDQVSSGLLSRPEKELLSSPHRHYGSCRELVGRHHIGCLYILPLKFLHAESILIDPHRQYLMSHTG